VKHVDRVECSYQGNDKNFDSNKMKETAMKRRDFHKGVLALGVGAPAGIVTGGSAEAAGADADYYLEQAKRLPVRKFDVVVAGAGTDIISGSNRSRFRAASALSCRLVFFMSEPGW